MRLKVDLPVGEHGGPWGRQTFGCGCEACAEGDRAYRHQNPFHPIEPEE